MFQQIKLYIICIQNTLYFLIFLRARRLEITLFEDMFYNFSIST